MAASVEGWTMGELLELFSPSRVAVVGATDREGSVGRAIMENLRGFEGEVVPVNPNRESVFGDPCVPEVGAAGDVDLAVIAVPVEAAVEAVRAAGEAGVEAVVVITAGFGEAGSEGAAREAELERAAAEYDLDLVGPNCVGVLGTPAGLNATFAPTGAEPGSISFLSQSGAVITAVLDWAADEGVGFRHVVSLGNKAVLDEADFVDAWGGDPGTDVVLGYLESVADGRRFVERTREVSRETPVVVLKSGRTEAGARAAASHTGAIAGSDRAYEAGLRAAGAIRAHSLQGLFDAGRALAGQPVPEGDGVAVVTNAGGAGVLATDAVGDTRLSLASLAPETVGTLGEVLPPGANRHNPVDIIGDADAARFREALAAVLADEGVAAAAVLAAPSAPLSFEALAEAVVDCQADAGIPIVAALMGGERVRAAEPALRAAGIPTYFDPGRAVGSLDALARYRERRERESESPGTFRVDRERADAVLDTARERGRTQLGVEAMALLEAYGIPTPAGAVADDPGEAVAVAEDIGDEVVLKIVSPDISHKSDIGGVRVGVPVGEVADAFEDLVARAYSYQPDARVLGVQVQELIDTDAGVETIVGATRDPTFGPVVLFGLGGIFVETLEDVAVRLAPVAGSEARAMTREIETAPLLQGARGREPVDTDAVVETIQRLSRLVTDYPGILELDVNPLVATPDGATAVDLRLTVEP
jgi:acetyltransferase